MNAVPTIVFTCATLIALVVTAYLWRRSRLLAAIIPVWFGAALAINAIGVFPGAGEWVEGDFVRLNLYSMAMAAPVLLYLILRWRNTAVRAAMEAIPLQHLAASQLYRIIGAVFFLAFAAGHAPAAVALPAATLDTFIGLTALPMAYAIARGSTRFARTWNWIGLFDFAWAFSMVMLSYLGLLALDPAPTSMGQSPVVLISLFQVPLAIIVHIELLRRL